MKLLRSHGIYKDKAGKNVMVALGFNYRLTDIQAALGISQLKKLDKFVSLRQQVASWYGEELKNIDQIILPTLTPHPFKGRGIKGEGLESAWHLYVIRVKNPKVRDRLWQYLIRKGIGANFHYPAVYFHPYYRAYGFAGFTLRSEEIYQKSCLTLPCYPTLSRSQVKFICATIKNFFYSHAKPN